MNSNIIEFPTIPARPARGAGAGRGRPGALKGGKVIEFPAPARDSSPGMSVEHFLVSSPMVRVRFPLRRAVHHAHAKLAVGVNSTDVESWLCGPLIELRHKAGGCWSELARARAAEEVIRFEAKLDVAGHPDGMLEMEPWEWELIRELAAFLEVTPAMVLRGAVTDIVMMRTKNAARRVD